MGPVDEIGEPLLRYMSKVIAMEVRNEMEDFHCAHLSDEEMAELNPIIRNAIYTALYALTHQDEEWCRGAVGFSERLIPSYWEEPELTEAAKTLREGVMDGSIDVSYFDHLSIGTARAGEQTGAQAQDLGRPVGQMERVPAYVAKSAGFWLSLPVDEFVTRLRQVEPSWHKIRPASDEDQERLQKAATRFLANHGLSSHEFLTNGRLDPNTLTVTLSTRGHLLTSDDYDDCREARKLWRSWNPAARRALRDLYANGIIDGCVAQWIDPRI